MRAFCSSVLFELGGFKKLIVCCQRVESRPQVLRCKCGLRAKAYKNTLPLDYWLLRLPNVIYEANLTGAGGNKRNMQNRER